MAPGFEDPLGLLAACHERIAGHCVTLVRLAAHVRVHGGDREAQVAARRVYDYFAEAGRWHHEDEERDLAPLLERYGDAGVRAAMARLMAEHRVLAEAYAPLAQALSLLAPAPTELPIEPYVGLMQAHLAAENREILPRAATLLPTSAITALGEAMAARRRLSRPAR